MPTYHYVVIYIGMGQIWDTLLVYSNGYRTWLPWPNSKIQNSLQSYMLSNDESCMLSTNINKFWVTYKKKKKKKVVQKKVINLGNLYLDLWILLGHDGPISNIIQAYKLTHNYILYYDVYLCFDHIQIIMASTKWVLKTLHSRIFMQPKNIEWCREWSNSEKTTWINR